MDIHSQVILLTPCVPKRITGYDDDDYLKTYVLLKINFSNFFFFVVLMFVYLIQLNLV
jgi:hypothetical protein